MEFIFGLLLKPDGLAQSFGEARIFAISVPDTRAKWQAPVLGMRDGWHQRRHGDRCRRRADF